VLIPYARQAIDPEDIAQVAEVLRSNNLTQGPAIERFERAVADYCGAKYAVAVCNATSALHIACLAAGLGEGDRLWTSPNTFVASANCGRYCKADVDFVDIDPKTYNMSAIRLREKLHSASKSGKLPKVVIPVDFAGQSCEMAEIAGLAEEYGFTIIEDASHAIGGSYQGIKVGAGRFAQMTVFSFHPVKIITTGEGGMILTNREDLYQKLIRLRSHGITREPSLMPYESEGPWYYQQIDLGYNYRMTDIQAALGFSQLQRIEAFVERRQYLAKRYDRLLREFPLILPWQHPDTFSAFHLYVIRLKLNKIEKSHREVFEDLRAHDIMVNLHYIPVHTQPYYRNLGFKDGDFPEAEKYYKEAISIPMFYGLTDEEQDRVVEVLGETIGVKSEVKLS
jgi:UDP-4-amino-4,6-dideoxy-N-acetyl-beta-L-altrosamine transaminase